MDGRVETASSLQDLVDCQFRWLLKQVLHLRAGAAYATPARERLLGNVAHALAQAVIPVGEVPVPDDVRRAAVLRIDEIIDRIAAPLRLPGASGELAFARTRIPESLASLAALLSVRRLSVVGIEVGRGRSFDGLHVRGRVDMIVRNASGDEAAIDLKWTRSVASRRREIEEGRAVQLAVYARLLDPGIGAPGAYYLLRQRELLSEAGSWLADEGLTAGRGLDETWEAIAADWAVLTASARSGQGLATGILGVADHLPAGLRLPAAGEVCAFCEMGRVCRVGGKA